MMDTSRGSCVCGAVRFEIDAPFLGFQYCHCSRCRKQSGSAHSANLFVPVAQLRWTEGQGHVRRFELPDAKYWCTAFCDRCGSTLPWLTKTGKAYVVGAGALDDDIESRPGMSIFFASKAPWYVHASELEAHDERPRR